MDRQPAEGVVERKCFIPEILFRHRMFLSRPSGEDGGDRNPFVWLNLATRTRCFLFFFFSVPRRVRHEEKDRRKMGVTFLLPQIETEAISKTIPVLDSSRKKVALVFLLSFSFGSALY